eukprot:CAMPEP_0172693572 /NCGR_PEP_ID=MMETSP1074-20121228/26086_1 /TAXON_ID=2916 /ORGANISM="Ceratium fusus, Strain PA161109" /LENGTH=86 /DNA_ID=CAMNT_0013513961 /DNA_START=577 /DNA_END=837 /DNA_ORIENTATION=-
MPALEMPPSNPVSSGGGCPVGIVLLWGAVPQLSHPITNSFVGCTQRCEQFAAPMTQLPLLLPAKSSAASVMQSRGCFEAGQLEHAL